MGLTQPAVLFARARKAWFALTFIVLFAWIDWVGHHDPLVAGLGGLAAIVAVLVWPDVMQVLRIGPVLQRLPAPVRAAVIAVPGLAFLALRARSETLVAVVAMVVAVTLVVLAPLLDPRLSRFYSARNTLPRAVRQVGAPVLAAVIGSIVASASLSGLPGLVGRAAATGASQANIGLTLIAALLSTAIGFLLLREPT